MAAILTPVLPRTEPESVGLDSERIERVYRLIERHVAERRYPGAQVAFARHGKLAALRTFGQARLEPTPQAADDRTLWLLYSQTKVVTTAGLWLLVERGALRFADRVADHVPEFARHGKGEITVHQLLTHQGGFPSANVPRAVWSDHDLLRRTVCDFTLEWTPGSKVVYHGSAAHWTAAVLIEALTGRDYRDFLRRELLDPLGLNDLFVGVPDGEQGRCADMHVVREKGLLRIPDEATADVDDAMAAANTSAFRAAGVPGGGGFATAAAMAAFYQMLAQGGTLNGVRLLSPRLVQVVTRNHTGDRVDENMGMPMHRGLGPHVRGTTPTIRGLGTLAHPSTFGHGGVGSSYSWADPQSGFSFSYLSNCRSDEPWHTARLDQVSNLAHAALLDV